MMAVWLIICPISNADTVSRLSTRFLARGEQALLEIAVSGNQPPETPHLPRVKGMEIRAADRGTIRQIPGRRVEYVYSYIVSTYEMGNHVLPSFEVIVGGVKTHTEPVDFTVFNPDDLKWAEAEVGNVRFRYASAFRIMNPSPFNGETAPVEIKIFVPRDIFVEDWGNPDFQRDGVTAWRFQPSSMRGSINLLGLPYLSVAYPSTLTPTREGAVSIGPATVRLVTTQVVMEGIMRRVSEEVNLEIPKLELKSQPLPAGAPDGFENAIGSFHISASTTLTDVIEGDPIPVDIVVDGSGNLDTLHPPKPIDADGWKMYEATTDQRGDERRDLSGTTVFHQFMRPLEVKAAIPAFRLVYFDPAEKTYKTLVTDKINLQMKPAVASTAPALTPPKAQAVPVEHMTDILGLMETPNLAKSSNWNPPGWIWHIVGACLALVLLLKALWMHYGHRLQKDSTQAAKYAALRDVERISASDDAGFLMSAGRVIERWLGSNPSPEIQAVLAKRDAVCFRMDKPVTPILDTKHRQEMLSLLRKSLTISLFIFLLVPWQANAGEPVANPAHLAYDSAKYTDAIALWLNSDRYENLSPDVLYNIGNACYRAGSPGHAVLYYRRALARDGSHQESLQNLRFIERKYGALTVHRPDYQYALARIPLTGWQNMAWTGLWLCGLGLLVFPATRYGARIRIVAMAALVIGPLLITFGALGWNYYPNDAEFVPLSRQAVIVEDNTSVHTDASRTSHDVIDAPPGSLCEVVRESGRWVYIAFASKTRGWVPAEAIEKILPATPPVPPKIHKPRADEKTA